MAALSSSWVAPRRLIRIVAEHCLFTRHDPCDTHQTGPDANQEETRSAMLRNTFRLSGGSVTSSHATIDFSRACCASSSIGAWSEPARRPEIAVCDQSMSVHGAQGRRVETSASVIGAYGRSLELYSVVTASDRPLSWATKHSSILRDQALSGVWVHVTGTISSPGHTLSSTDTDSRSGFRPR